MRPLPTWPMPSPPWFRDLCLGNSRPFRCVEQSSASLGCRSARYVCLPATNSLKRAATVDLGPSRWMSRGMRSCRGLRGPASGLGSRCCQFRRKRNGRGSQRDNFKPGDVGQMIVVSPIARKRRVNRQETHQR